MQIHEPFFAPRGCISAQFAPEFDDFHTLPMSEQAYITEPSALQATPIQFASPLEPMVVTSVQSAPEFVEK
jgi:hypothetical protein